MFRLALGFLCFAALAPAQDERRVVSPDGQIEFRLFIATQGNTNLSRIAYAVTYRGKPMLEMSFLGLDIFNQEPMLGENDGLTSSSTFKGPLYHLLTAKFMQNGSLGRLITIEARAYDDGVAFRYVIPPSTPLTEILIAEEATEFRFPEEVGTDPSIHLAGGWLRISEAEAGNYPAMQLVPQDSRTLLTRLVRTNTARIAFEGRTPLTCPWRIIAIGPDRESVKKGPQP